MKKIQLALLPEVEPIVEDDLEAVQPGQPEVDQAEGSELILTREQFKALLVEVTKGRQRDAFNAHMYEHAKIEGYEGTAKRYHKLVELEELLTAFLKEQGRKNFRLKLTIL